MTFSRISVHPTWALFMTQISRTAASLTRSMIARWYGARSVRHRPGSALDSLLSLLSASAHWLTVNRGGGRRIDSRSLAVSLAFCQLFSGLRTWVEVGELGQGLVELSVDEVSSKVRIPGVHARRELRGRGEQARAERRERPAHHGGHVSAVHELAALLGVLELRFLALRSREPRALLVEVEELLVVERRRLGRATADELVAHVGPVVERLAAAALPRLQSPLAERLRRDAEEQRGHLLVEQQPLV